MMKIIEIKSKVFDPTWKIQAQNELSDADKEFIEIFIPLIYHNDAESYLWSYDTKLPSGKWLENIIFSNDLKTATALVL